MFTLVDANINNIELIKDIKLENIFSCSGEFGEDDLDMIKEYVDMTAREFLSSSKIIIINDAIAGIFIVREFEDGLLIDEIYLYDEYRNKGIGSKLINDVKHENVYLWVYKNNTSAISLYKKLGFEIIDETETRFKMKKHQ